MMEARGPDRIERVPSGIPGLDLILSGGFLRGGTYILVGTPGAGKTILGNQICFHHVAHGGRAIYVTLLAESHSRMLAHLRSLAFFDPAPIAASLTYVSGYRVLEKEGLGSLLDLLRRQIREQRATMLVIDGLVSAEAFAPDELAFKKFVHELNTLVSFVGCTAFLLTNGSPRFANPEHTMVDGLVELSDPVMGMRAVRELWVRKFRGSDHLRGRHVFEITDAGIVVYPRIEALLSKPAAVPRQGRERLGFATPELDRMVGGGLAAGSSTLLIGPSGSGKTTLGLSFLAASSLDEPGLFFGFFESPPRLLAKGEAIGLPLGGLCAESSLEILWQPPAEQIADALAAKLLAAVQRRKVKRLFIDGLQGFRESTAHPERIPRFFAALINELRALDVCTLCSQETRELFGSTVELPIDGVSAVTENMLFVRQVEQGARLQHVLGVVKTRDSARDPELRAFSVTPRGLVFGRAPATLAPRAKGSGKPSPKPRSHKRAKPRRRGGSG